MQTYQIINLDIAASSVSVLYQNTDFGLSKTLTLKLPLLDSDTWQSEVTALVESNYPTQSIVAAATEVPQISVPDSDQNAYIGTIGQITSAPGETNEEQQQRFFNTLIDLENLGAVWVDSETFEAFFVGPNPVVYGDISRMYAGSREENAIIGLRKAKRIEDLTSTRERLYYSPTVARPTKNAELKEIDKTLAFITREMSKTYSKIYEYSDSDIDAVSGYTTKRQTNIINANQRVWQLAQQNIYSEYSTQHQLIDGFSYPVDEFLNLDMSNTTINDSDAPNSLLPLLPLFKPPYNITRDYEDYGLAGATLEGGAVYSDNELSVVCGPSTNSAFVLTDDVTDSETNFSVSVWFKSIHTTGDHRTLVHEIGAGGFTHPIINIVNDEYRVGFYNGDSDVYSVETTGTAFTNSTLQNVTMTYDGDNLSLYVNGSLAGQATGVTRQLPTSDHKYQIMGSSTNLAANFFDADTSDNDIRGNLYSVKMWRAALDSDTAVANYNWEHELFSKISP